MEGKIEAIKAVILKRVAILDKVIKIRKEREIECEWYKGRRAGLMDCYDLLNSTEESIRIEL